MVLKPEVLLMLPGLIQQERTDHPAGNCFREEVQHIRIRHGCIFSPPVIHGFAPLFGYDKAFADIFLQLLPNRGLIKHPRLRKRGQAQIDFICNVRQRHPDLRRMQDIKQDKMQRDIPICKALRLPCLV